MDILATLLSEGLLEQVRAEIGDKDIKLVDLKTGDYVAKDKYDNAVKDLETTRTELAERTEDIKNLGNIEGLTEEHKNEINKIQSEFEIKEQEYQTKLANNEFNSIVDLAIAKSGAIDSIGVKANISDKIKDLKVVEGKVDGLDEIINGLKETHKHYYPTNLPGGGGIDTKIPPKEVSLEEDMRNQMFGKK